ncbi:sporulation membrane protein YtaF [Paenibacillus sp. GCM10023252]|uniref:sporulation membrane protein YtaF n=1 Tax=Paenibacillus sp. GCM10023252 TaxID=3252649 RepID=UPI00361CF825
MFTHLAALLLLAFAVSVDGFGVGITYGLRRIRIPIVSVIIIACCSGTIIWLSMQAGTLLSTYLNPSAARWAGAVILIALGTWGLLQQYRRRNNTEPAGTAEEPAAATPHTEATAAQPNATMVVIVELKRLGLVVQILKTPQAADVDRSGSISASEAVMLGVALSLDAFGAGLGAAMVGLPPLITAMLITLSSAIFLLSGMRFGFRFADWRGVKAVSLLPGILLIVMGIMKLL